MRTSTTLKPLAALALTAALCRCSGGAAPKETAQNRPVPVVVGRVARQNVPVVLEGLGSVVAYNTVTVRPRVEGLLQTVAFREGQAVKRGDLLAQIDPRPFLIQLHQAQAALARDTSQLKATRANLDRFVSVRGLNLIPQQQVDDQRGVVGQNEATIQGDAAAVESAQLQLQYARITSPIDGVTGLRLVDPGNVVHPTDPTGIVLITQLDPVAVLISLPQDDLPRLSEQMAKGMLQVVAISRDGKEELAKGEVALVDNQINASTGTIRLKAIFANPKHALWPNQFVKARVLLSTLTNALVVPASALQRGPKGSFVYVVDDAKKASVQPVQVEQLEAELVVLRGGVTEGQTVVVDGQSQLRPGSFVAPRAPEAARGNSGGQPHGKDHP